MPDIDNMEAGPELNARVAERVMGHRWCMYSIDTGIQGRILRRPVPEAETFWDGVEEAVANLHHLKPYSTDWAAAGEVLERIRSQPYLKQSAFMLTLGEAIRNAGGVPEWYPGGCWAALYLAPLAICRAACLAVEKGGTDG